MLDKACNRKSTYNIPLFIKNNISNATISNETEITNVDALFYTERNGKKKIKLMCEIEESDRTPIRIFGKYHTAKKAEWWKDENRDENQFDDIDKKDCYFLQILKDYDNKNSKKRSQWYNIEKSLQKTGNYKIIWGTEENFKKPGKKLSKKIAPSPALYNPYDEIIKFLKKI